MGKSKKNIAIIVLAFFVVILIAMNICFMVFAKSSVTKGKIEKQEVEETLGEDVSYDTKADDFKVSTSTKITDSKEADEKKEITSTEKLSNEDYVFPDSDARKLKKSELKGLTKEELRIARNELYARHGYIFEDEGLKEYFESKSWYIPSVEGEDFNDEELFNKYEIANRNLIKKVEASKK